MELKEKLIDEINDILCEYYEAATNGHLCTEEIQAFMGNKDWADTILYRTLVTMFPENIESRAFWDSDKNEEVIKNIDARPFWVKELMGE